jgi:tRNA dimethylallyltransferase
LRRSIDTLLKKDFVIAIVGPTGAGKSRLAISLGRQFNGEIVNADSRQVYRHMDIGTAKPSPEERSRIPQHLFDIIDPDQTFSLAEYQALAVDTIKDIHGRGRIPFLVGGSGQYVWGLLEGWQIPRVAPDLELRAKLAKEAAEIGIDALYQKLQALDPAAARNIDKRNVRRVIRALEVGLNSENKNSKPRTKKDPGYNKLIIGLTAPRPALYNLIDNRVDNMIEQGLFEETRALLLKGYNLDLPAMSSIGYKQAGLFLHGEINREDAIYQIKAETHRFVRHQYAWFRLKDERINWFAVQNNDIEPELMTLISDFFESSADML